MWRKEPESQDLVEFRLSQGNQLEKFLTEFPDANWNCQALSVNPNLTWAYVEKNLGKYWDWSWGLSRHQCVTFEIIKKFPNKRWSIGDFSLNPNLTMEIVIENKDLPWNRQAVTQHPCVTVEIFEKYRDQFNWSYEDLSYNKNFTFEFIKNHLDFPWDWKEITRRDEITLEIVLQYKEIPWNLELVLSKPSVTWEFLQKHADQYLRFRANFYYISQNPNITWEIVKNNPQYPWNFQNLSLNRNITWEIVIDNPQYEWNYEYLRQNKNITNELIRHHPQFASALNPNKFSSYGKKPLRNPSENPLLTWKTFKNNNPKIRLDFKKLSSNYFLFDTEACKFMYKRDLEKRRRQVEKILPDYLCSDVNNLILKYLS